MNNRTAKKHARINNTFSNNSNYNDCNDNNIQTIRRINNTSSEYENYDKNMEVIKIFINTVKSLNVYSKKEDWNVGYNLWNALTQDHKDLITSIR